MWVDIRPAQWPTWGELPGNPVVTRPRSAILGENCCGSLAGVFFVDGARAAVSQ
jgi:hypothetical protein